MLVGLSSRVKWPHEQSFNYQKGAWHCNRGFHPGWEINSIFGNGENTSGWTSSLNVASCLLLIPAGISQLGMLASLINIVLRKNTTYRGSRLWWFFVSSFLWLVWSIWNVCLCPLNCCKDTFLRRLFQSAVSWKLETKHLTSWPQGGVNYLQIEHNITVVRFRTDLSPMSRLKAWSNQTDSS